MRTLHILPFFCGLIFLLEGCSPPSFSVTVMSFNIHHGEGMDGRIDLERIAATINAAHPHIVALQEVDSVCGRSGGIDQAAELSRMTGMQAVYGSAFPYDGGQYGNAVLTRLPILGRKVVPLPGEPRSLLILEMSDSSGKHHFQFLATHLDTEQEARLAALPLIHSSIEERPSLLAGDLNAAPQDPCMDLLREDWNLAGEPHPTFPSGHPEQQIDYILFRPATAWKVLKTYVLPDSLSSDHRPLVSEMVGWKAKI